MRNQGLRAQRYQFVEWPLNKFLSLYQLHVSFANYQRWICEQLIPCDQAYVPVHSQQMPLSFPFCLLLLTPKVPVSIT